MTKFLLKQLLGIVTQNESVIVGALMSGSVALASDLHIVINKASLAAILAPVITTIIVELDKSAGVAVTQAQAAKE